MVDPNLDRLFVSLDLGPNFLQRLSTYQLTAKVAASNKELSGRVLDTRIRGCRFKPHWLYCVVSLSKVINPCLVLVQHRKTSPDITEKLLTGM